jgi:hypothetical protein
MSRSFNYFGLVSNNFSVKLSHDGDFYLYTPYTEYHFNPFHHDNSVGKCYFHDNDLSQNELEMLSARIHNANLAGNNSVNITTAFTITWSIEIKKKLTLFQVVLCMDNSTTSSFMIVSYAKLDILPDTSIFFYDIDLHEIAFEASTTGSNCGVPGQYIFQLNTMKSATTCTLF